MIEPPPSLRLRPEAVVGGDNSKVRVCDTPDVTRSPVGYPFTPKSTARLAAGQFWSVRRDDGRFGVGIVLGVPTPDTAPHHPTSTRVFAAGLLGVVIERPATTADLDDARLVDWGYAHVQSIGATGTDGLGGLTDSPFDDVLKVSHRGGGAVGLYGNGTYRRDATTDEARTLDVFGTWGLTFIQRLASQLP